MTDAADTHPPARGRRGWATPGLALALAAGTALLYARVAGFEFIRFDDNRYLTDNLTVQRGLTWDGVAWAFTTFHASNWHPLTWLSHMLDVELFGLDAGAHHLVSAVLHGLNAALLLVVLARMTGARGRSLVVALLFAVHPLHVESVAWVAERKDVLSTAFGLLALLAWAAYADRPRPAAYAATIAAFVASLLAKPMWVTFPFLLVLLDYWPLCRIAGVSPAVEPGQGERPRVSPSRAALEKLPFLAIAALSSAVTVVAQDRGGSLTDLSLGPMIRVGNAAASYLKYAALSLWPTNLAIFYPYEPLSPWTALGAVTVVAAATAAVLAFARRVPWLAVGWCWFLGTLVPVIGIVQVGGQALADRYTYLPATGLFVAAAWGAHRLAGAWRGGVPLAAAWGAAILALSGATLRQIEAWASNEALFRSAIEATGGNAVAHGVLSDGLRAAGRLDEALLHAREAVRLEPAAARHWTNLAAVLADLKRPAEARDAAARAVALNGAFALGWTALGLAEQELGNLAAAEGALARVTELAPADPQAWFRVGLVRARAGRAPDAAAAYQRALDLAPNHFGAWTNLAVLEDQAGRAADAARAFEAAVRAEPGNYVGWRNLALLLAKTGRPAEAEAALRRALQLRPDDPDLLLRLGRVQLARGLRAEALEIAARLDARAPQAAAELRARAASGP